MGDHDGADWVITMGEMRSPTVRSTVKLGAEAEDPGEGSARATPSAGRSENSAHVADTR